MCLKSCEMLVQCLCVQVAIISQHNFIHYISFIHWGNSEKLPRVCKQTTQILNRECSNTQKLNQNHRVAWVVRDFKDHLVPTTCHGNLWMLFKISRKKKLPWNYILCCVTFRLYCTQTNTLLRQRGIWDNWFKYFFFDRIKTEFLHLLHWCKFRVIQLSEFRAPILYFATVSDTCLPINTAQTLGFESLSVWTQTWFKKSANRIYPLSLIIFT